MKLLLIGVPDKIKEDVIVMATAKFAETIGINVHCQTINTLSFEVDNSEEENLAKNILKDIITVCTSTGHERALIIANFMRLVHDGKLTLKEVKLLRQYPEIVDEMVKQHRCPCLKDLLISTEIILSL